MSSFLLIITIIIFTACAPYRVKEKPASFPPRLKQKKYYLVKKGDSLWKISKKYNIGVEEIMKENKISSPQELKSGQLIFIPRYVRNIKELEFHWPIRGKIVNFFGEKVNNIKNRGLNIKAKANSEVKASARGRIVFADYLKGWGKTLILKHEHKFYTVYANINEIAVKRGHFVKEGEVIAKVGSCSNQSGCILHFEIRNEHMPQNPLMYLADAS